MALVKITGKAIVSGKTKFVPPEPLPEPFTIWDFTQPLDGATVTNFSVGYDDGNMFLNTGTGFQQINSDTSVNFTI